MESSGSLRACSVKKEEVASIQLPLVGNGKVDIFFPNGHSVHTFSQRKEMVICIPYYLELYTVFCQACCVLMAYGQYLMYSGMVIKVGKLWVAKQGLEAPIDLCNRKKGDVT